MRKALAILITVCLLIPALSIFSSAECERIFENPSIVVTKKTPVIDGVISDDEGWSDWAHLNEDTAGYFYMFMPLTSTVDFRFAYSDDGLYFAANQN